MIISHPKKHRHFKIYTLKSLWKQQNRYYAWLVVFVITSRKFILWVFNDTHRQFIFQPYYDLFVSAKKQMQFYPFCFSIRSKLKCDIAWENWHTLYITEHFLLMSIYYILSSILMVKLTVMSNKHYCHVQMLSDKFVNIIRQLPI